MGEARRRGTFEERKAQAIAIKQMSQDNLEAIGAAGVAAGKAGRLLASLLTLVQAMEKPTPGATLEMENE